MEKVKTSVEDRGVQTDFPISSHQESAATSPEASNSGRGAQDKSESEQGNINTEMHR